MSENKDKRISELEVAMMDVWPSEEGQTEEPQAQERRGFDELLEAFGGTMSNERETLENNEERAPLESRLREAAERSGAGENTQTPAKSINSLYDGYVNILTAIAGRIAGFAPLTGPGGVYGFLNPSIVLDGKLHSGTLDWMPMDDWESVHNSTTEMAKLWEGQQVMQGTQLARNAILFVVLHDEYLREKALEKVQRLIGEHCVLLEECHYPPC